MTFGLSPERLADLRNEAMSLVNQGRYAMRSCWDCNLAHEHLKDSPSVINCHACGRWFFKGVDVTEPEEDTKE